MTTPYVYDRFSRCVVGGNIQPIAVDGEFAAAQAIEVLHARERAGLPPQPREQRLQIAGDRLIRAIAFGAPSIPEARRAAGMGRSASDEAVRELLLQKLVERRDRGRRVVLTNAGAARARELGLEPGRSVSPAHDRLNRVRRALGKYVLPVAAVHRGSGLSHEAAAATLRDMVSAGEVVRIMSGAKPIGYRLAAAPDATEAAAAELRARVVAALDVAPRPMSIAKLANAFQSATSLVTHAVRVLEAQGVVRRRFTHPSGWVLAVRSDADFDPPPTARPLSKHARREVALLELLSVLAEADAPVARDALCYRLGRGAGYVAGMLADLSDAGGVVHVKIGKRGVGWALTPAGRAALEVAAPFHGLVTGDAWRGSPEALGLPPVPTATPEGFRLRAAPVGASDPAEREEP